MITTGALIYGDTARFLDFDKAEHPVALQLGGSDPDDMTRSAELVQQWGYDEVNINVGCPSDRVQSGSFGACLMRTPDLVAQNIKPVSYTHLRAHETEADLVCRLLLEKKKHIS